MNIKFIADKFGMTNDEVRNLVKVAKQYDSAEQFEYGLSEQSRHVQEQVYQPCGIESALAMRLEGGSLAEYNYRSQVEWLQDYPSSDGTVTLYRVTLGGISITPGDYVSNSKPYVQLHNKSNIGGVGIITKVKSTLDDIFPADGPKEFWYAPKWIENFDAKQFYDYVMLTRE